MTRGCSSLAQGRGQRVMVAVMGRAQGFFGKGVLKTKVIILRDRCDEVFCNEVVSIHVPMERTNIAWLANGFNLWFCCLR